MAHMFRKYTSNRGSALFMVISTMTALMISCMAMYFSMVSARSSQYAVFNQMQASQSAQSIAEIVYKSISDPANFGKGGGVLRDEMIKLGIGESITTDANGFKSLDPSLATGMDESQLGAYSVTITRLPDYPNGDKRFDIMVISSVDGNRDAVHLETGYNEGSEDDPVVGEDGSGGDAELFSATGYIPNDAYINGGYYMTDVFYDTQFTYMNAYEVGSKNRIAQSLSTGGDLMIGQNAMTVIGHYESEAISDAEVDKIGPVTWAVRGNFYTGFGNDFEMRAGSNVLVGGNLSFMSNSNNFFVRLNYKDNAKNTPDGHICVYINGDFNYGGDKLKPNVWYFVNGNITNVKNEAETNVKVFVTGDASERAAKAGSLSNLNVQEWPINGAFADGMNYTEAMQLLGQKTQTISYYKWDLTPNTNSGQHIDVRLNATNQDWKDDKGVTYEKNTCTYILAYNKDVPSAKYIKGVGANGKDPGAVGSSFIIDSLWTHGDQDHSQTILIDTGDDPNNIMTIKLSDVTGKGEFAWFVDRDETVINWWPYEAVYGDPKVPTGNVNGSRKRLVLIKGRGTVLIDVPKGVTYEDASYQQTSHIGWWMVVASQGAGAQIKTQDGHLIFEGAKYDDKYAAKLGTFIHKTCDGVNQGGDASKGDGCVFSTSQSTAKCNECSGNLTQVKCSIHGDVNKYCATCHPEKKDRTDWCVNHVDKKAFETFYGTLNDSQKAEVTDKNGIVYPNTNYMLVSCEESADIRFTMLKDGREIVANSFFGFIYAPYMTFLASGGTQLAGTIKLLGGMTVGDYDIQSDYIYFGCYPDKMPNEIAGMTGGGSMAGGKLSGTTKSWKFEIGGYR